MAAKEATKGRDDSKKKKLSKEPIDERNTRDTLNQNETVTEKVANWFKDIFNVCGNSGCCGSKNPYYDKKSWDDLNQRITYQQDSDSPELKKKSKNSKKVKLQNFNEDDDQILKGKKSKTKK